MVPERQRKIPGWIVVVDENVSVNKWAYRQYKIETVQWVFLFSFSNFTFHHDFNGYQLKKVENNSMRFLNYRADENLVVNNKGQ